MKYVIVIPDGCADEPQEALDGKTPLAAAQTPHMDSVVQSGVVGRANNVPASLPAGSAVANMSLLGYDPLAHFSGRAPLEAAAQGIELGERDWAIRCNLVTIEDQVMRDFTADHITTEEATALLTSLQEAVDNSALEFVPGVSYRNLLLYRDGAIPAPFDIHTRTTPPHDLTDRTVADDYPRGPGSSLLIDLMTLSSQVFADHPVNAARVAAGKLPATNVWLWGQGRTPALARFQDTYDKSGVMITAVDLLRGIASLIGWDRIEVEGATGYLDTDYAGKGRAAINAIDQYDVVCVHVEAPDEASHEGDAAKKIEALEQIDTHIVGPLLETLKDRGDFRLLVSPDHPTPVRTKTHSHGAVPFAICGDGILADDNSQYDEPTADASELAFDEGWQLMNFFLNSK